MKSILMTFCLFFSLCFPPQHIDLTKKLKEKLEKDGFTFTQKLQSDMKIYNCDTNEVISLGKHSQKQYYAKSKTAIPTNYYPDFQLTVLKFDNENSAAQSFILAKTALKNTRKFCNGKGPNKVVLKKNMLFFFESRAEMFREYTEKYGNFIDNYR